MLKQVIPILRIFDIAKAKEFYVDYLGFNIDWEHRFEPELPLYMQLTLGTVTIHLSEHHGDCTPGAAIRIEMSGLHQLHQQLTAKSYRYLRPGIEKTPWELEEMTLTDPFGNRLVFYESSASQCRHCVFLPGYCEACPLAARQM